ncbi:unnamed protein product [Leuciscus chuanchicus]
MKSMNAVNAVQLFTLVWTFTAVCQADDDISVSCEDVTGTVKKEVTFTCSVSLNKSGCCITGYKFQYPEIHKESDFCKQTVSKCSQRNSFTCSFSPTTAMTEQFRFFVQTNCGNKRTEFTVDITETVSEDPGKKETSKSEPDTEDPGKKETSKSEPDTEDPEEPVLDQSETSQHEKAEDRGFKVAVIAAAVSCFIIVIMPIIYKMKQNYKQKRRFLDNNPENMI